MQPSESDPTAFNRPDLLANGETAESNRILAALEGEARRGAFTRKTKSGGHSVRKRFVALWLVPAGALAAWIIYQSTQTNLYEDANLASPKSMHNVQVAASSLTPTASFAPEKIAVASQAAVITDELSPQSGASPEPLVNSTAPGQKPAPLEDSGTSTSTGALLEALEGRSTSPKDASVNAKPNTRKSNQVATGKTSSQTASGKNTRKSPPQSTKQKPRSKNDTDVALLTALVSAVNEPEKPTQSSTPKLAESDKKSKASNRDIVERTAQDSTESLLARCKRLGVLEGELCRWRICSGHDSDAACKVP